VYELIIPLPPLDEQKRIVAKLDEANNHFESLERNILIEKAALIRLESAKREAVLETLAQQSQVESLSDFASVNYGYTDSASMSKSGPKFLRITDIQNGEVDWDEVPKCEIAKEQFKSKRLHEGDLVFARTGATTGKSYLIPVGIPESVAASYLIRVRVNRDDVDPAFLGIYFKSSRYWEAINAGTSGSAQGGFNASKLKELQIPIPNSLSTQRDALREVEVVTTLIKLKSVALNQRSSAISKLKQSILSSAFAGQL